MCAAGCYGGSIAHALKISCETLYARCKMDNGEDFTAFRVRHVQRGDDALRLRQYKMALKGNERLLIFLGKNRLGQREKVEHSGLPPAPPTSVTVQVLPPSFEQGNGG